MLEGCLQEVYQENFCSSYYLTLSRYTEFNIHVYFLYFFSNGAKLIKTRMPCVILAPRLNNWKVYQVEYEFDASIMYRLLLQLH